MTAEWYGEAQHLGWYVALLNRCLNKLTGRLGLNFDREHQRYYFQPDEPGKPKEVTYRPLNNPRATRKVVWQPVRQSTGEPRNHWLHRAVHLRFIQASPGTWLLSIRPELRVTSDGVNPIDSRQIGRRVTRAKSRMFNYDLLGEVQFWRDFLGHSSPQIVFPFGPQPQRMIISTAMGSGKVQWPGIPDEHAMPFKNVEYLDDLFTWAEGGSLTMTTSTGMMNRGCVGLLRRWRGDDVNPPARPRPPAALLAPPAQFITNAYLPEPLLLFAEDGLHVDPKAGIARYGPRSRTSAGPHPARLRVGFIGGAEQVDIARRWLTEQAKGVNGDEKNPEFPGWMPDRGFFSALEFADPWDEELGQTELRQVLETRSQRDRFDAMLQLIDGKLQMLAERDSPPDYVLIALSDDIIARCRTAEYTTQEERSRAPGPSPCPEGPGHAVPDSHAAAAGGHERRTGRDSALAHRVELLHWHVLQGRGLPVESPRTCARDVLRRHRLLPAAGQPLPDDADQPRAGVRRAR